MPRATKDPKARAEAFVKRLADSEEIARAAMATAQQIMEHQANRKRNPAEAFKVGEKVWLNLKNSTTPQLKRKLSWTQARFTISKVISPEVYELGMENSQQRPRFHVDRPTPEISKRPPTFSTTRQNKNDNKENRQSKKRKVLR
ncbi:hypothetical protein ANO14919_062900 [Xylariales sp. No.14919]|nr:hypothetical protein ANO14919_062900 [Xylariales sp. No.14919]